MIDKLDFLVRFWELKARNASLGEPLAPREQIELLSLMQLVTGDLDTPQIGPIDRPRGALPAQMIGDGFERQIFEHGVSSEQRAFAGAQKNCRVRQGPREFGESRPDLRSSTAAGMKDHATGAGVPEIG